MTDNNEIIIKGKRYALVTDEIGGGDECERCELYGTCQNNCAGSLCQDVYGEDESRDKRFAVAEDKDVLTEEKIYDYYQERSQTAGDRATQLAWMFIVMQTGALVAGKLYAGFLTAAALATVFALLSVLQSLWQSVTAWIFKQQVKRGGLTPDDYPSWVGAGAWTLFWLKMASIAAAVVYFVWSIWG